MAYTNNKEPVDKWIIDPMKRFLNNSTMYPDGFYLSRIAGILYN